MADRKANGQFKKGHAGYKTRNQCSELRRQLKSQEPAIVKAAIDQAVSGKNQSALLYLLKKLYGTDQLSTCLNPNSKDPLACSESILNSFGAVDGSVLLSASRALEAHLKILEVVDFEERLKKLEEQQ